jgi:endonuclease III-like uncharacterized protein
VKTIPLRVVICERIIKKLSLFKVSRICLYSHFSTSTSWLLTTTQQGRETLDNVYFILKNIIINIDDYSRLIAQNKYIEQDMISQIV